MLPPSIANLTEKFRLFPGIGFRSSQKLSLDVLQMSQENYEEFIKAIQETRDKVKFCQDCGFFAEGQLCEICQNNSRNNQQLCLVEKPTDVISLEKSEIYRGKYQVLNNLISPLDNIFPEDTTLPDLFERRLPQIFKLNENTLPKMNINASLEERKARPKIELILFFKSGFAAEATTAYLRETIAHKGWSDRVEISRLAQGLPLYFNPDTLDQATMAKALEDRREIL
jgi:recombination protein RecR